MTEPKSSNAWTFRLGGELPIHRLGFGAMRLTGPGIWGEPADPPEAIRTLRRARELGIDFIDTADSYGPDVSERLIREALHPYGDMRVATKAGLARTGPDRWVPLGRPEYLIQQAHKSLRQLGVDRIDLWQLHRIDPKVPRDEQFGAVKALLDAGIIRHAGLSEVTVERDRGGLEGLSGGDGAEPLQPGRSRQRGGAHLLRARRGSGSSPGFRSARASSRSRARASTRSPRATAEPSVRSCSPGRSGRAP